MKEHEIDKLFKNKIKDLEYSVDPKVWKQIESELDSKPKVLPLPKKQKSIIFYILGAAMALVIISLGVYRIQNSPDQKISLAQVEETISIAPTDEYNDLDNELSEAEPPSFSNKQKSNNISESKHIAKNTNQTPPKSTDIAPKRYSVQSLSEMQASTLTLSKTDLNRLHSTNLSLKNEITEIQFLDDVETPKGLTHNEEVTYAYAAEKTVITKLLNTFSNSLETPKKIIFSNDEEGTLTIELINRLAKSK